MERVESLWGDVLRRHKTPGVPRHRFTNAFGSPPVVGGRRARGCDTRGRHACACMAMCTAPARPVRRPAPGRQPDAPRGQGGDPGHQGSADEALAHDALAPRMPPDTVQEPLGEGDAPYAPRGLHWPRLLWLPGFTALSLMLAHCSRSAPGAGPFHYDPSPHSASFSQRQRACAAPFHAAGCWRKPAWIHDPHRRGTRPKRQI
jgi:hypothetical protein